MFYHSCLYRAAAAGAVAMAILLLRAEASVLQAQQLSEYKMMRRQAPQDAAGAAPAAPVQAVGELVGLRGPPEPVNFVIHCQEDEWRLQRFQKHMDAEGLSFEVFPCIHLDKEQFDDAVEKRYFGSGASKALLKRSGALAVALAHMKLLDHIIRRGLPAANIFEDDEVPLPGYKMERAKILGSLPADAEYVQLNALWPSGEYVPLTDRRVRKTGRSKNLNVNIWLSNYYVSAEGANKVLRLMRNYDMGPNAVLEIDWWLSNAVSAACSICTMNSWVVNESNTISAHCQNLSTKEPANKRGIKLLTGLEEPPPPAICFEMIPQESTTLKPSIAPALVPALDKVA